MNSLSWLLYFADVVGNLSVFFLMIAIAGVIVVVFPIIPAMIIEKDYDWGRLARKAFCILLPIIFICGLLSALSPSRDTVYMIAASEAGEEVVNNPEVRELMGDTLKLIRQKIKDELE